MDDFTKLSAALNRLCSNVRRSDDSVHNAVEILDRASYDAASLTGQFADDAESAIREARTELTNLISVWHHGYLQKADSLNQALRA